MTYRQPQPRSNLIRVAPLALILGVAVLSPRGEAVADSPCASTAIELALDKTARAGEFKFSHANDDGVLYYALYDASVGRNPALTAFSTTSPCPLPPRIATDGARGIYLWRAGKRQNRAQVPVVAAYVPQTDALYPAIRAMLQRKPRREIADLLYEAVLKSELFYPASSDQAKQYQAALVKRASLLAAVQPGLQRECGAAGHPYYDGKPPPRVEERAAFSCALYFELEHPTR